VGRSVAWARVDDRTDEEHRRLPRPPALPQQVLALQAAAGNRATAAALGVYREKADPAKADPKFRARWPGSGPDQFYAAIRPLVEAARTGDKQAAQTLTGLVEDMKANKHNRAYILSKIRVEAEKSPGAVHGSGLDELFQTANTSVWIERAAGRHKGVRPHSVYNDKPFTWVDAQDYARVRTESVLWFTKQLLSGHSGAVWRTTGKGWFTNYQAQFHKDRDAAEAKSSSPRNAVIRAMLFMLSVTANLAAWADPTNKFRGESGGGHDLTDVLERTNAWITYQKYRDQMKTALQAFETASYEDPKLQIGPAPEGHEGFGAMDIVTGEQQIYAPASPAYEGWAPPSPVHEPIPYVPPEHAWQWGSFLQQAQAWNQ
jgi:hypothetical protein